MKRKKNTTVEPRRQESAAMKISFGSRSRKSLVRHPVAEGPRQNRGPSAEWTKRKRAPWDAYFMRIAQEVATRSTCDRKNVGAVIVRDKTILSTGYNGSVRGMPHCDDMGHFMENGHCIATVHAEANAIIQAAKNGVAVDGADIYITASPCWHCFKLIANSGIRRIYYLEFYRDTHVIEVAGQAGIELRQVTLTK